MVLKSRDSHLTFSAFGGVSSAVWGIGSTVRLHLRNQPFQRFHRNAISYDRQLNKSWQLGRNQWKLHLLASFFSNRLRLSEVTEGFPPNISVTSHWLLLLQYRAGWCSAISNIPLIKKKKKNESRQSRCRHETFARLPQSSCLTNTTKPQMSFRKWVRLTTRTFPADWVHLARNKWMVNPSPLLCVPSNHMQYSSLTVQQRQRVWRKLSSAGCGGRNPAPAWDYASNKS